MPIERGDVVQAYRLFLGREASEAEVTAMQQGVPDIDSLRRIFFQSAEFKAQTGAAEQKGPPQTIVHLHVPKSAGTSLNEILRKNFAPPQVLQIATHELDQLVSRPPAERRKLKVVMGHLQHGMATKLPQPSVYVAVLRDPGPRIYSFFRFIRRHRPHPLFAEFERLNLDFGGFLRYSLQNPAVRIEIDNGQSRRLAGRMQGGGDPDPRRIFAEAMANMTAPDMIIGTTERFETLLYTLWTRGLLNDAGNRFENVGNTGDHYDEAIASLDSEGQDLLESYSYWDRLLHQAADVLIDGTQCELPGASADAAPGKTA